MRCTLVHAAAALALSLPLSSRTPIHPPGPAGPEREPAVRRAEPGLE